QLPVETRRRNLEIVCPRDRVLDIEQRADLPADQLAIRKRHAALVVRPPIDVHTHQPAASKLQIDVDELIAERRQRRLDQPDQTLLVRTGSHFSIRDQNRQKKGLRAHCSTPNLLARPALRPRQNKKPQAGPLPNHRVGIRTYQRVRRSGPAVSAERITRENGQYANKNIRSAVETTAPRSRFL